MRWMVFALTVSAMAAVGACTKPNPDVCCSGPADCAAHGIPEDRTCSADLVCLNHSCEVPQCTESSQCDASAPICELSTYSCRGCIDDDECDSGACADDGSCVPEGEIVYVSSNGGSTGSCTRGAPCSLAFAGTQFAATRNRIVLERGTYSIADSAEKLQLDPGESYPVYVHGHLSRIETTSTGPMLGTLFDFRDHPATVRDLDIARIGINAIEAGAGLRLDRVSVNDKIVVARELHADRVVLNQAYLQVTDTATVSIQNLVAHGTSVTPLSLGQATGTVRFVTIANTGGSSANAAGIECAGAVRVEASIVWTPGSTNPAIVGCVLDNVIAGPVSQLDARNTDPGFRNLDVNDFHLEPTSPAIDAADDGPLHDFEGDVRPQGARWDLGADEAKQ